MTDTHRAIGQQRASTGLPAASSRRALDRNRILLAKVSLLLGGVLLPFDDLGVLSAAGGLGRSPAWIPLLLAGSLLERANTARLPTWAWALWSYGAVVTLGTLPFLPDEARGETVFVKGIKVALTVSIWILVLRAGFVCSRLVPRALQLSAALCFVLLAVFAFIPVGSAFDTSTIFHATENIAQRVRGPRFEASALGAGMLVSLALMFAPRRDSASALALVAGISVTVALTASRGTLLTSVAGGALAIFCAARAYSSSKSANAESHSSSDSRAVASVVLTAGLILAFGLNLIVNSQYWSGLQAANSDATRAIWSQVSLYTIVEYPFGQGYAGSLVWSSSQIEAAIVEVGNNFSTEDLSEAAGLTVADTDRALSPKTLPGLATVYFGVLGLIAICAMLYQMGLLVSRARMGMLASASAVMLVLVATSYYSSPFSWEQPLLLGALLGLVGSGTASGEERLR